jgi:hypothetical protein
MKEQNNVYNVGWILMIVVLSVFSYHLYLNYARARASFHYTGCQQNLKDIGKALYGYTSDKGMCPENLEQLMPEYLPQIPKCTKRKSIYTYRFNAEDSVFTVYCAGNNHPEVGACVGCPIVTSKFGMIPLGGYWTHPEFPWKAFEKNPVETNTLLLVVSPDEVYDFSDLETAEKTINNNPACLTIRDYKGRTILFEAARDRRPKLTSLIISKTNEVDPKDKEGRTPLFELVNWSGNRTMIKLLLDKGADPNVRDKKGKDMLDGTFVTDRETIELIEKYRSKKGK